MIKIDQRKELNELYSASKKKPSLVEVPPMRFLMVDGEGNPAEKEFQEDANTIYPVTYTLKFMIRAYENIDYKVMPMEVQWRVNREQKSSYSWTMMIMQPEFITEDLYKEAKERELKLKGKRAIFQNCVSMNWMRDYVCKCFILGLIS